MICKKCWADAYMRMVSNPMLSQTDHYQCLLEERKDNPCSEKEEFGIDDPCPKCGGDVGHLINCPNGSAFSGDMKTIKNNPLGKGGGDE